MSGIIPKPARVASARPESASPHRDGRPLKVSPSCDGARGQAHFPGGTGAEHSALGGDDLVRIGDPKRTYTVEPLEDPVPQEVPESPAEPREPEQEPEPQPVEAG
jgi:hypothetical protein